MNFFKNQKVRVSKLQIFLHLTWNLSCHSNTPDCFIAVSQYTIVQDGLVSKGFESFRYKEWMHIGTVFAVNFSRQIQWWKHIGTILICLYATLDFSFSLQFHQTYVSRLLFICILFWANNRFIDLDLNFVL